MNAKAQSHFGLIIILLLIAARAAGNAAESKPSEWEKTLKSAETEGEVTVYVVDYPRFTVSQFQKFFPKIRLNQLRAPAVRRFRPALWPNGARKNIKPISMWRDKGRMCPFYIRQKLWLLCLPL